MPADFLLTDQTWVGVCYSESLLVLEANKRVGVCSSESLLVLEARDCVGVCSSESLLVIGSQKRYRGMFV